MAVVWQTGHIISETKLDGTFPNSQFYVQGFRLSRNDRNIHGSGLMAFVRSDICFTVVTDLENLSAADRSRFIYFFFFLDLELNP